MATNKFDEQYINQAFYVWYTRGKKVNAELIDNLPDDTERTKPAQRTVSTWVIDYSWEERADALDAEVAKNMDTEAIEKRKKMFEKQEEVANELIEKGMGFLRDHGIESDNAAIRAISLGLDTQRISVGVAEQFAKISKMDDKQLVSSLMQLLGKPKQESVEGEILEEAE